MNAWEHARVQEQILFQSYDWISGLIARSDSFDKDLYDYKGDIYSFL